MLLAAFGGFPRSGSTQDVCHSVVSFMTGVLDEFVLLAILVEPERPGPRSRPDGNQVQALLTALFLSRAARVPLPANQRKRSTW